MIRYLKLSFIFLCIFAQTNTSLLAQEKLIVFTKASDLPPYTAAINGFKEDLKKNNIQYKLVEYNTESNPPPEIQKADLIFSIGTNPTKIVAENYKNIPIIFTLSIA